MSSTTTTLESSVAGKTASAPVERLTYRLDELAAALGVSRRILERERSADRLLKPDIRIG
jgi:hypothetical protein